MVDYDVIDPQGSPNGDILIDDVYSIEVSNWNVGDEITGTALFPSGGCIASISSTAPWILTIDDCNGTQLMPFVYSTHVNYSTDTLSVISDDLGTIYLDKDIDLTSDALVFAKPFGRALNFAENKLITGINIIDDMLLWTDGRTEPKKINIPRSLRGTDISGNRHTRLVNDSLDMGLDIPAPYLDTLISEENITVIKKSPLTPLSLQFNTGRNANWDQSVPMIISDDTNAVSSSFTSSSEVNGIYDFSSLSIGDKFRVELPTNIDGGDVFDLKDLNGDSWKEGTRVVLREYTDAGDITIPVRNFRIKGHIGSWTGNKTTASSGDPGKLEIVIEYMDTEVPVVDTGTTKNYIIDISDSSSNVFEFKFPRFSYRYKYEDGEYSTFAPFTEVAFLPGNFEFHPKEGYNLGMTNSIKSLTLKDFNTLATPSDVVSIDLLYKDDQSTNIYVVDTIKPKSETTPNPWQENSYTVTSDIIHRVLPSNQLLRSWDNVPKRALAQEVVGNRIVYGNYTQGHDLQYAGTDIYPNFVHSLTPVQDNIKSIKSLREYQLGVVFVDKFGRETPVVTNKTASFKIDKEDANKANKLNVSFSGGSIPQEMEYFKFYIKETSGEYYNMAMDRWYDAEDGGIWLSFASSDRNKVDIDTFLILKKGVESNNLVLDPARYKVLAIEGNAPDFIKSTKFNCGEIGQVKNNNKLFDDGLENAPLIGRSEFAADLYRFGSTSLARLDELIIDHDIYVDFYVEDGTDLATKKYRITNCSKDEVDKDVQPLSHTSHNFTFTIDGYLEEDVTRIFDGPSDSPSNVKDNAVMRFYKSVKENAPRFDGKFFVKVFADGSKFTSEIQDIDTEEIDQKKYTTILSKKVYYMAEDHADRHGEGTTTGGKYDFTAFGDVDYFSDLMSGAGAGAVPHLPSWLEDNEHKHMEMFPVNVLEHHRINVSKQDQNFGWKYIPTNYQSFRAYFKNSVTNLWDEGSATDRERGRKAMSNPANAAEFTIPSVLSRATIMFGIQDDGKMKGVNSDYGFENVTFIDQGPYKNTNAWWEDPFRRDGFGGSWVGAGGQGQKPGIVNYNNQGSMELSFGPVMPEYGIEEKDGKIKLEGDKNSRAKWEEWDEDFWNFNSDNRLRYNNSTHTKVINKLTSGTKFRWTDDPNQTVYTVFKDYTHVGVNRYSISGKHLSLFNLNSGYSGSGEYAGEYKTKFSPGGYIQSRIDRPFYWAGENFTKNARVKFFPPMQWEPTMQGVEGAITNGLEIKTIKHPSHGYFNLVALAGSWTETSFAIEDFYFNSTYDSTYGELSEIKVGMLLTHVISRGGNNTVTHLTDSDAKLLNGGYLIKNITKNGTEYVLEFEGYTSIYSSDDDSVTATGFNGNDSGGGSVGAAYLRFYQPSMNGLSVNSVQNALNNNAVTGRVIGIGAVGYTLEVVEEIRENTTIPTNPAIWETEPKESTGLDIYYEISGQNPIALNEKTISTALPIKSVVSFPFAMSLPLGDTKDVHIEGYWAPVSDTIILSEFICIGTCTDQEGDTIPPLLAGDILKINKPDGSTTTVTVKETLDANTTHSNDINFSKVIKIERNLYNNNHTLAWHNCFSFGNGVESNRIRDNFNLPYISNGVKASITTEDFPRQEERKYGLIYSGIYNSNTSVNNLNQFIMAEKITKDINPTYGSIQKLHTRDSDLLALCEDKVLKILANKDAVYNADANPQLTATQNVLGQTIPFGGEYGISNNPESFASEAYRVYFTDKTRGAVLRLSKDGLTAISDHGMRDWFRDNLKLNAQLIGSYDDRKDEYNITVNSANQTVSFSEKVKGWVSFKSFIAPNAVSCANEYYTFKGSSLYKHHDENAPRNTFYGIHTPSSINVLLNDEPGVVKTFKTLNYEGSQSRIEPLNSYQIYLPGTIDPNTGVGVPNPDAPNPLSDGQYYNLTSQDGWYVEKIETDLEKGSLNEFIEKEGKWFNYIRGIADVSTTQGVFLGEFESSDSSFQGLGRLIEAQVINVSGCTDPAAINYDESAVYDDGSCVAQILGCTDQFASNPCANGCNTDDGSCIYLGCTDPTATNYDASANQNDGSCISYIYGCTDPTMFNYDASANTDDGSCVPFVYGCTNSAADNYNVAANTDDGSCIYSILGCTDASSCNYEFAATVDDGTCTYCGDSNADNYDGAGTGCTTGCLACDFNDSGWQLQNFAFTPTTDTTIGITWGAPTTGGNQQSTYDPAPVVQYEIRYSEAGQNSWTTIIVSTPPSGLYYIQNLTQNTSYDIQVRSVCSTTTSNWSPVLTAQTQITVVSGCTDASACNTDPLANTDDGSCEYTSCAGCMDQNYLGYDPAATIDDQSQCGDQIVYGCTDSSMYNYDSSANTDNNSCIPFAYGCTDATLDYGGNTAATNYDVSANTDDGSCNYNIDIDLSVNLFASNASFVVGTNQSPQGVVFTWTLTVDGTVISSYSSGGNQAQTPTQIETSLLNSNNNASNLTTIDQTNYSFGTNWTVTGTASWPGTNISDVAFTETFIPIEGCTDPTQCNYDPTANYTTPGSCIVPAGCDDSAALNYDASITCPDNANDCTYCATDPDIVNATLITEVVDNTHKFVWDDIGETFAGINGMYQGIVNVPFAGGSYQRAAYKIDFRWKLPNGAWTNWAPYNENYNVGSCSATSTFAETSGLYISVGAGNDPNSGLPHGSTGAYNSGTKWQLRVRNRCNDCTSGSNIKTPILQIQ